MDGTNPLLVPPTAAPQFRAELAPANTAAGDGDSKGEPIRDAKPIEGGNLQKPYTTVSLIQEFHKNSIRVISEIIIDCEYFTNVIY